MVETNQVCDSHTSTGKDGKEYPRQVERKAPEPELPITPPRMISIQVAAPSQVNRVAAKATWGQDKGNGRT